VSAVETLPSETLVELASSAPPMPGGEYLNPDVLGALWDRIDTACRTELADAKQTVQEFLKGRNPAWQPRRPRALRKLAAKPPMALHRITLTRLERDRR
jgi:hypothetical protein